MLCIAGWPRSRAPWRVDHCCPHWCTDRVCLRAYSQAQHQFHCIHPVVGVTCNATASRTHTWCIPRTVAHTPALHLPPNCSLGIPPRGGGWDAVHVLSAGTHAVWLLPATNWHVKQVGQLQLACGRATWGVRRARYSRNVPLSRGYARMIMCCRRPGCTAPSPHCCCLAADKSRLLSCHPGTAPAKIRCCVYMTQSNDHATHRRTLRKDVARPAALALRRWRAFRAISCQAPHQRVACLADITRCALRGGVRHCIEAQASLRTCGVAWQYLTAAVRGTSPAAVQTPGVLTPLVLSRVHSDPSERGDAQATCCCRHRCVLKCSLSLFVNQHPSLKTHVP